MSARRLSLLAALVVLASCNKTNTRPGLRLSGPSAVAVFQGLTLRDGGTLRPYLAVANERGDDLRILDAVDGTAVLAPSLIQSLSVPTAPRPALLAAGPLPVAGGAAAADLLVVAPAGLAACDPADPADPPRLAGCIQVVDTWSSNVALAPALAVVVGGLAGDPDAPVLSLAVVPVPVDDGAGGWLATPGRARVAAGLGGGRLLLADYARAADGVAIELVGFAVHDLGFEAVSLSGSPDNLHLYAASPDLDGVAELDLRGAFDQAPAIRVLTAGAPTTHVLAARVRPFAALGTDRTLDVHGPEVVRVYAALDPERCGADQAVACGLVVLDPVAGGRLPDPVEPALPAAPIALRGHVLGLTAVYPSAVPGVLAGGAVAPEGLQKQAMLGGDRFVSTLAAVALSGGEIALVDLARGALALDRDVLGSASGGSPTRTITATSSTPPKADVQPRLALWDARPPLTEATAVRSVDATVLPKLVTLTPGYTPTESWTVQWEAVLPNLLNLRGQVQGLGAGAGLAWVAVQSSSGADAASGPYRGVGRLYDPRLGIHVGDLVAVTPDDTLACPRGTFELEVTALLPPGPDFPGGAVAVTPLPVDRQPTTVEGTTVIPADPHCLDEAGRSGAKITFRAGGLLLAGVSFGYAGRVEPLASATSPGTVLAAEPPGLRACAMLDDPTWPPAACEGTCRTDCEALFLARKARRQFYVAEACLPADTTCLERWSALAVAGQVINPVGPALAFKAGWVYPTADESVRPARGMGVTIVTASGQVPLVRRPISGSLNVGAVLPAGLATFDRAQALGQADPGRRVFVAYTGNLVMDFSPAQAESAVTVHR